MERKNKGGAPKKSENEKINKGIQIYFNKIEIEFLKEKNMYNHFKLKTIILESIANDKIIFQTDKDPNYLLELNKLGININQIVKKANSINVLSQNDIQKLNEILNLIKEKLQNDS